MNRIENWDSVTPIMGGFQALPAGAYKVKVLNAYASNSKRGNEMLVLEIDIADGEYKDYFAHRYEEKKRFNAEAKWPCNYYQLTEGDERTIGRYKGLIMAFEQSNMDYHWDFNEAGLKGLVVGCIFREEEYLGTDNKVHSNCKAIQTIPVDDIASAHVPEKKKLEQNVEEDYGPIPW